MSQLQSSVGNGTLPGRRASKIVAKRFVSGDESRWDAFVRASAAGSFYHLSGWQKIIESCLNHPTYYLYSEIDGEIDAILPLVHVKSLLLRFCSTVAYRGGYVSRG